MLIALAYVSSTVPWKGHRSQNRNRSLFEISVWVFLSVFFYPMDALATNTSIRWVNIIWPRVNRLFTFKSEIVIGQVYSKNINENKNAKEKDVTEREHKNSELWKMTKHTNIPTTIFVFLSCLNIGVYIQCIVVWVQICAG